MVLRARVLGYSRTMHARPARSSASLHLPHAPLALPAIVMSTLLMCSAAGCGGRQHEESTPEPPEDTSEPAPAPEPPARTVATPLAPAGGPRTLPSTDRATPPGSGVAMEPFVEPTRVPRVQPPGTTPEPEPEFDTEIVSARIQASADAITACYDRELARDPNLRGRLHIEFRLMPDGSVIDVIAIQNSLTPVVASCVTAIIGGFQFSPGPVGGSILYRYPFEFEPHSR